MLNHNVWGSFKEANPSHDGSNGFDPSRKKQSKRDLFDYEEDEMLLEEEDFYSLEDDDDFDGYSYFI